MLNDRLNRNRLSKFARVTIVIALLTITIAVAAAQVFATFSGSLADVSGGVLPGAKLILTNTERQAKYEVSSNQYGQFEFVGLPPGEYLFQAQVPGFMPFRETLTVEGQNTQRNITLRLGTLEETITISDKPSGSRVRMPSEPRPARANPPCPASPVGGNIPVGGHIRAPHKLRDVAPDYPANLRASATEGVVVMQGRIGLDGFITDLQMRNEAHPDFVSALTNAVSQWQFDSTLLNCVPVEPAITVTARFVHQP